MTPGVFTDGPVVSQCVTQDGGSASLLGESVVQPLLGKPNTRSTTLSTCQPAHLGGYRCALHQGHSLLAQASSRYSARVGIVYLLDCYGDVLQSLALRYWDEYPMNLDMIYFQQCAYHFKIPLPE